MIGDTEMIDIFKDVEKHLEGINAGLATCKNFVLKVTVRISIRTADYDKRFFACKIAGLDENICKIERFTKQIYKKFKVSRNNIGSIFLEITTESIPHINNNLLVSANDWAIFELLESDVEFPNIVEIYNDEFFKNNYEVVL